MLEPGQTIDRYTVDRVLGQGGMAVVYRVTHDQLGSYHALKVLTLSSPGIRDRLMQEGRVQASLRHPNVVAVTDVIEVEGNPGLVMEYVDGPSLEEWMREHEPAFDRAEHLFRSVVAGVMAAHDQGLVHRDLKPANVMLEPESGGGYVPKVTDFGLAKALAGDAGMQQTRSGVTMGTPQYMAPEQIRDAKNVDKRADIFSLGCLLYELACGRPPFAGPDVLSIFNQVASGSYPPPVSLAPDLPARIQNAIQGALVVDRERRIPDCHVLLSVLEGAAWPAAEQEPAGETLAPAGETFAFDELPTDEAPAAAAGGLQQVPTEPPATDAGDDGAPEGHDEARQRELEGTLSPGSAPSIDAGSGRRRRWWLVPLVVLPLVALAVVAMGLGVALWVAASRWEAGFAERVAAATGGEVSWADARVRPRGLVLHEVVVLGSDGGPVAHADAVRLRGAWRPGVFRPRTARVEGLSIEARRADGGWVVPTTTRALLTAQTEQGVALSLERLQVGPTSISLEDAQGRLEVTLGAATLSGLALDASTPEPWTAEAMRLDELRVAAGDPVLVADQIAIGPDGVVAVEGAEAWLRLRPDGLVDVPPVIGGAVPTWLGGSDRRWQAAPWLGLSVSGLPLEPTRLEVGSGTVHVLDRAHAAKTVQWDVELDRLGVGPVAEEWLPFDASGRSGDARVTLTGELRRDGMLRGRLGLRRLALPRVGPYVDASLRRYAVEPSGGTLDAEVQFTAKADSLAARLQARGEQVGFERVARPEGAPSPPSRSERLLATRDVVEASTEVAGSLADPAFEPVDALVDAIAGELFAPVGGAFEVDPPRAAAPAPAPPASPAPRPATPKEIERPRDREVGVEGPPGKRGPRIGGGRDGGDEGGMTRPGSDETAQRTAEPAADDEGGMTRPASDETAQRTAEPEGDDEVAGDEPASEPAADDEGGMTRPGSDDEASDEEVGSDGGPADEEQDTGASEGERERERPLDEFGREVREALDKLDLPPIGGGTRR